MDTLPADRRTAALPLNCPSPRLLLLLDDAADEAPVEQNQFTVGGAGGGDLSRLDPGFEGGQPAGVIGG